MEMKLLEEKIKSYIQKVKKDKIISPIAKKRIKTANFTKILKNKIFKGYEKIKIVRNKNFNINKFLKSKPEEKYLLSDERYNIYYDNKYLNKYKPISQSNFFLLKNITVINKSQTNINKNIKHKSTSQLLLNNEKNKNIRKLKRQALYENKIKEIASNINDSSKIFNNIKENSLCSKYPFIYLEKIPDEIVNPTDMRNYPHYIPKYKDKNKNQEYFLYNLSHLKEKKVKNIYHCLTPKPKNRLKNNEINKNEKFYLVSFSPEKIKENINKKFNIDSIHNHKIKKMFYKTFSDIQSKN